MARHGSPKHARTELVALGLMIAALALPVLAQEATPPAPATPDTAAAATEPAGPPTASLPTSDRVEKVMAPTDSLAFGKTIADSASLLPPVIEPRGGLLGAMENNPVGAALLRGGIFMWLLVALLIYGVYLVIDRLWTVNRARINTRRLIGTVVTTLKTDGVQAAAEECQKWRGPVAAVLYSGLQKADRGDDAIDRAVNTAGVIEMSYLERGLAGLASLTTLAPLVGVLGAVASLIRAFRVPPARVSPHLLGNSLPDAMLPIVVGLVVAVLAGLTYNYILGRIESFTREMESASSELKGTLRAMP